MKLISSLLALFIILPIWYYLMYQILVRVNASELMMFLFWVYIPISIFVHICQKLAEGEE